MLPKDVHQTNFKNTAAKNYVKKNLAKNVRRESSRKNVEASQKQIFL